MLVRLNLKDKTREELSGRVNLKYVTYRGESKTQHYDIKYGSPIN